MTLKTWISKLLTTLNPANREQCGISDEAFFEIIDSGSVEEVNAAIEAGANIHAEDDDCEQSILMRALNPFGPPNPNVVKRLLEAGAAKGRTWKFVIPTIISHYRIEDMFSNEKGVHSKRYKRFLSEMLPPLKETLRELLKYGADVNAQREDENLSLVQVLEMEHGGDPEIILLLLDHGASPHLTGQSDCKSPWVAAINAVLDNRLSAELIDEFIAHGADINAEDAYALREASRRDKSMKFVSMMLDRGAKINTQCNYDGNTALIEAVENGHLETVLYLLDCGADANLKNWKGSRAIDLLDKSLEGSEVHRRLEAASSALDWTQATSNDRDFLIMLNATQATDEDVIKAIEAGSNVNARENFGPQGRTALMLAVWSRGIEVVEKLLAKGAQINAKDNEGNTALILAIQARAMEKFSMLIEHDADVNAADESGKTALHWAVRRDTNTIPMLSLLIEHGANIDATDDEGDTALHASLQQGRDDRIVLFLIEHGADIHIADEYGYTPLSLAMQRPKILSCLFEHGVDIHAIDEYNRSVLIYVIAEHVNCHIEGDKLLEGIAMLLQKGVDVNVKDDYGTTALIASICLYSPFDFKLAKMLIEKGAYASINAQDNDGETALMRAAESDRSENGEFVSLLLENGAEPDIQDNKGEYALMKAAINGNRGAYERLLQYGASDQLKDNDGATAFDRAKWNKNRIVRGCVVYE